MWRKEGDLQEPRLALGLRLKELDGPIRDPVAHVQPLIEGVADAAALVVAAVETLERFVAGQLFREPLSIIVLRLLVLGIRLAQFHGLIAVRVALRREMVLADAGVQ